MHIAKSDKYKKRPGWTALVRLGIDDCEAYKSGGGSLFKWDGLTCDDKSIIQAVNSKPQTIPVFYAAYHEYGAMESGNYPGLTIAPKLVRKPRRFWLT